MIPLIDQADKLVKEGIIFSPPLDLFCEQRPHKGISRLWGFNNTKT
jgi:hypothetical protein